THERVFCHLIDLGPCWLGHRLVPSIGAGAGTDRRIPRAPGWAFRLTCTSPVLGGPVTCRARGVVDARPCGKRRSRPATPPTGCRRGGSAVRVLAQPALRPSGTGDAAAGQRRESGGAAAAAGAQPPMRGG